jgi:NAD(P)-dependent dehydrogenase (short-subunit alcohol dehydrogenase family)
MRILVIGASGVIGRAIVAELSGAAHEVIHAGRQARDVQVDITSMSSVQAMYAAVGPLDAVIVAAGQVHFGPLQRMSSEQFALGLHDKLLGQVHVVLAGQAQLRDGGSFTLTSGITAEQPILDGSNASTVGAAIEGFVRAAAVELPRGLRINAVSPTVLSESAEAYAPYFPGFEAVPGSRVAKYYRRSVEGVQSGQVYRIWK